MSAEVNLGDKHTLLTTEWAFLSFIAMVTTLVVSFGYHPCIVGTLQTWMFRASKVDVQAATTIISIR